MINWKNLRLRQIGSGVRSSQLSLSDSKWHNMTLNMNIYTLERHDVSYCIQSEMEYFWIKNNSKMHRKDHFGRARQLISICRGGWDSIEILLWNAFKWEYWCTSSFEMKCTKNNGVIKSLSRIFFDHVFLVQSKLNHSITFFNLQMHALWLSRQQWMPWYMHFI